MPLVWALLFFWQAKKLRRPPCGGRLGKKITGRLSLAGLVVRLSAARKARAIVQPIYGRGGRRVAKGYLVWKRGPKKEMAPVRGPAGQEDHRATLWLGW